MRLQSFDEPSSSIKKCELRYEILKPYMKPGGIGAELGVFKGAFIDWMLLTQPSKLYIVDPWFRVAKDWTWAKGDPSTIRAFSAILEAFSEEIGSQLIEPRVEYSQDFLRSLPDDHLDWVYIDSTHGYGQTMLELEYSLAKVKSDGYIMGDDYTSDATHPHHGVYRAVNDLVEMKKITLLVDGDSRQFVARRPCTEDSSIWAKRRTTCR